MWVIWVPLIAAWITSPFVASSQDPVRHPLIGVPEFARIEPVLVMVRWAAAGAAVVCLLLSIQCWQHMGSDWRMGVDPTNDHKLITDDQGRRLAKRDNARSIRTLREQGWTSERVRRELGFA